MLLISPSHWRVLLMTSVVFILYGATSVIIPPPGTDALRWAFVVFAFLISLISVACAVVERKHLVEWWLNLLIAASNFAIAIIAALYPLVDPTLREGEFLGTLVGIQGIVLGCLSLAMSIDLTHELRLHRTFIPFTTMSVASAILMLANPFGGRVENHWLFGVYGLACGLSLLPSVISIKERA